MLGSDRIRLHIWFHLTPEFIYSFYVCLLVCFFNKYLLGTYQKCVRYCGGHNGNQIDKIHEWVHTWIWSQFSGMYRWNGFIFSCHCFQLHSFFFYMSDRFPPLFSFKYTELKSQSYSQLKMYLLFSLLQQPSFRSVGFEKGWGQSLHFYSSSFSLKKC